MFLANNRVVWVLTINLKNVRTDLALDRLEETLHAARAIAIVIKQHNHVSVLQMNADVLSRDVEQRECDWKDQHRRGNNLIHSSLYTNSCELVFSSPASSSTELALWSCAVRILSESRISGFLNYLAPVNLFLTMLALCFSSSAC